MNNRKAFLQQLLQEDSWSSEQWDWIREYLEGDDLSELQEIAEQDFQTDLIQMRATLDRELSRQLLKNIHERAGINDHSFKGIFRLRFRRIAVAATTLLIVGTAAWFLKDMGKPKLIVFNTTDDRKALTLPDGSQIQLEKASTISYYQNFGSNNRELSLTGEAYFDVKTDGKHPFVINTPSMKTTVLGTSFNMSVREGEAPKVVVVSGKIQVKVNTKGKETEHNAVILTANNEVVFNLSTNEPTIVDGTDDARFYAMKSAGKFTYKDARIKDVARDVERLYNVKVDLKGSIANCPWNGDFDTALGLMPMLELMAGANNGTVEVIANGKEYLITGSCSSR